LYKIYLFSLQVKICPNNYAIAKASHRCKKSRLLHEIQGVVKISVRKESHFLYLLHTGLPEPPVTTGEGNKRQHSTHGSTVQQVPEETQLRIPQTVILQ